MRNMKTLALASASATALAAAAPQHRALVGVRADATNPTALYEQLNRAFEAFKEKHDAQIAEAMKGFDDVVAKDQVDRINAQITELEKDLDKAVKAAQKAALGGGVGEPLSEERRAHAEAFNTFFRRGAEAGLKDLEVAAALSTSSDEDGGFVVPMEMSNEIDRVVADEGSIRRLATVRSISAQTYKKLVNQGGASSGWVGETDARGETGTPKLRGIDFPTMELYANPAITQQALDDASLDLGAWLADEVSIEFSTQEGDAFINGDGVSKPRGILGYTNVVNASYEWGKVGYVKTGAAAGFNTATVDETNSPADALIALQHSLKRQYRRNGVFLMNDGTIETVRKFKTTEGEYIWRAGIEAGAPSTLLGKPIETDDFMPDVGANAFPIAFADFRRAYLIVDRVGVRVLRDPFTNKPYIHFYTTKRVGGGLQNYEAIKLLRCAA